MIRNGILTIVLLLTQFSLTAQPQILNKHSSTDSSADAYHNNPQSALGQSNNVLVPINGPLRVSSKNPRYFADRNGNIVYLEGSHFWDNLQDSGTAGELPYPLDYSKWLDFLQANNHNFFRLWAWEQAKWVAESSTPYTFTPTIYTRTGPGMALDGKPKFNLNQFNQAYFDRLRQRVIEAGQHGMYVSVMLFNGWSVDPKAGPGGAGINNPWIGHPYNINNNINGINGDPNGDNSGIETEDLSIPAVTALQEAYIKKVIDTVGDLDNVLYEICNECADGSWQSSDSTQWQYHMIDLIHQYEATKPKQHPVGMTLISANDAALFASKAEWISIHDSGSLDSPYVADGSKVIILDTDHICGICGDRKWVWKSFTRGKNPIFMDQYDDSYKLNGGGYVPNNPKDVSLRLNLGYTLMYANRMNLAAMTPQPNLCSSGFCLANPNPPDPEYLAYLPTGGSINIDLSGTSGILAVEWFNPATGTFASDKNVNGGANRSLTAPFSGDAVVHLVPLSLDSVGVFRPSNGVIFLKNSNITGYADVALNYGVGGDYPITGDWNGNGIDSIGVYRKGVFYLRYTNTVGYADIYFPFGSGLPGDQPVAGDWNGDGVDTIGVYNSRTITFYLRESNTAGPPDHVFRLGIPGDIGIAGDWTGKGFDTVGVFRPSNGVIFLKNANNTGYADIALNYGLPGDKPVTGDWNNDGVDSIGVLRGNIFYLRNSNTVGFADMSFALGVPGDMPIAGNWDGLP